MISASQGLYLYTNTEKRIHIHIYALSGIEPMIPASEQTETVHALDRSVTVTGATLSFIFTKLHAKL
jgi:hypothetical protein